METTHNIPDIDKIPGQLLILSEVLKLDIKLNRLEELLATQTTSQSPAVEAPLDINEAADFLKLKRPTMNWGVQKGFIPHHRPNGKKLYFYASELNDWVRSGKGKTVKEIEAEAENEFIRSRKGSKS